MMTLSTSTWLSSRIPGTDRVYSFEETAIDLKKAGFDFLDANLWFYTERGQLLSHDDWEEQAYRMKETAEKVGVQFRQTHGHALSGKNWDDLNYPDREYAWEMNHRCIRITKILGADWMVMHPYNLPHDPIYNRKKALDANTAYLAPFLEQAKKEGVGIALENMVDFGSNRRRYCGGDPEELLEAVDVFHDPSLGICIDTGHAHQSGIDVGTFIRMVGSRLKCTHIDDNLRDRDSHLPPYMGSIDWEDTLAALRDIGYSGDFSFELGSHRIPHEMREIWYRSICDLGKRMLTL